MKKITSLIILSCIVTTLLSQTSVWKVSKGDREIYLAGTIHLLRPSDLPLPNAFNAALEASDVLYVEADMHKMQEPQVAQQMMTKMMLTEGTTIQDLLEENTYKSLEEQCNAAGLPLSQLASFKPALVIVTLTSMKLMNLGVSSEGVDLNLIKKAKDQHKTIKFMETVEEQIALIANMGNGNEDAFVRYSLDDLDKIENEFTSLITEWKTGSHEKMDEAALEMMNDFPDLYTALLLERNEAWLKKIEPLFNNDSTEMIAVGTLHLHGDDGLISQLQAKGYRIVQME